MQVAAGEADVAKQMVIELHQIGEAPALGQTAEQRREIRSHLVVLTEFGVAAGWGRAICTGDDEWAMNAAVMFDGVAEAVKIEISLPDFPVEGGCQCGAVRYRLLGPPLAAYLCHCKDCQRLGASAFSLSMPIAREHVELVSGTPAACDKTADSGRVVRMLGCGQCGTKLWNEPLAASGMVMLKPATLDDSSWIRPVGNIWTASKMPWVEIDESLVNFAGQPPDRQPLYDAWEQAVAAGRRRV